MNNVVINLSNGSSTEYPNATFKVLDSGVLQVDGVTTEYFSPAGWLWVAQR